MKMRSLLFGARPSFFAWASWFLLGFSLTVGLYCLTTGEPLLNEALAPYLVLLGAVLWRCLLMAEVTKLTLLILRDPPVSKQLYACLVFMAGTVVLNLFTFKMPSYTPSLLDCLMSWVPVAIICGVDTIASISLYAENELQNLLYRQQMYHKKNMPGVSTPLWMRELRKELESTPTYRAYHDLA